MRLHGLQLLLVGTLLAAGCDGGSGPSVASPSEAKSAGDVSAAVNAPAEAAKKISPRLKKKREGMLARPGSPE